MSATDPQWREGPSRAELAMQAMQNLTPDEYLNLSLRQKEIAQEILEKGQATVASDPHGYHTHISFYREPEDYSLSPAQLARMRQRDPRSLVGMHVDLPDTLASWPNQTVAGLSRSLRKSARLQQLHMNQRREQSRMNFLEFLPTTSSSERRSSLSDLYSATKTEVNIELSSSEASALRNVLTYGAAAAARRIPIISPKPNYLTGSN